MSQNEYQIRGYKNQQEVTDSEYFTLRREAIKAAKVLLKRDDIDEVDMQVIYNADEYDSELADVYWSITDSGIVKHA